MKADNNNKLGIFPFIIGGLSFIPLIGIIFGILAIVWGIKTEKVGGRKLIIIGSIGCWMTVAAYALLLFFDVMKPGGMYGDMRSQSAQKNLQEIVKIVEFYKTQNGSYPRSLETLVANLDQKGQKIINDPTTIGQKEGSKTFYYELTDGGNGYYLFSVGPDGTPFTGDDLQPAIEINKHSNLGLKTSR